MIIYIPFRIYSGYNVYVEFACGCGDTKTLTNIMKDDFYYVKTSMETAYRFMRAYSADISFYGDCRPGTK